MVCSLLVSVWNPQTVVPTAVDEVLTHPTTNPTVNNLETATSLLIIVMVFSWLLKLYQSMLDELSKKPPGNQKPDGDWDDDQKKGRKGGPPDGDGDSGSGKGKQPKSDLPASKPNYRRSTPKTPLTR